MQFRIRSIEKEYLDSNEIATADLKRNLRELNIINTLLGGYKVSEKGLVHIIRNGKSVRTLFDIGFGGGDSIRRLALVGKKEGLPIFIHGVDINPECLAYAEKNLFSIPNKRLHCLNYRLVPPAFFDSIDVIHCSLFLHHLRDEEIVCLFRKALLHDSILLINDLHRHWFAYYSIRFLTALFSRSWLVRNDAPLSVRRGFTRNELRELLQQAGFTKFEIRWRWAFRFQVIAYS